MYITTITTIMFFPEYKSHFIKNNAYKFQCGTYTVDMRIITSVGTRNSDDLYIHNSYTMHLRAAAVGLDGCMLHKG